VVGSVSSVANGVIARGDRQGWSGSRRPDASARRPHARSPATRSAVR